MNKEHTWAKNRRDFCLASECRKKVRSVAADPRPHLPEQVLKEKPARQGETVGFSGPNKAGMAVQTRGTRIQGRANFTAVRGVNFQKVVSVALPARPQEAKPLCAGSGARAVVFLCLFIPASATCSADAYN